ncbi:heavy-metal-associated domain-containing protein [Roseococcus thiosulfatophilus]|uniref:heavy-metal-associated domain-containing protein n=1 Tax=Roseococcus thiosulfatophilus TaxID=35813 RepID=UPI001A8FC38A|nr:cation transporter [Roseococcus thiosulfatophilus]
MAIMELTVQGLTCGHCVRAVTEAIQARDPAAQVAVTLDGGKVRAETVLDRLAMVAAIEGEGYKVLG